MENNEKKYWNTMLYGFLDESNEHLCVQYHGLFPDEATPEKIAYEAQKMSDTFPAITEIWWVACRPGLKKEFDESRKGLANRTDFWIDVTREGWPIKFNR